MMTMRDVIQHVQTVQRRVNERVTPKLSPPKQATPRKRVKAGKPRDEREALTQEGQEREERAKTCLKNGGPKRSQVC